MLDYLAKKSIKCPVLLAQFEGKYRPIWGKIDFLGIFGVKHTGLSVKKVKIMLDIIGAFWGIA